MDKDLNVLLSLFRAGILLTVIRLTRGTDTRCR